MVIVNWYQPVTQTALSNKFGINANAALDALFDMGVVKEDWIEVNGKLTRLLRIAPEGKRLVETVVSATTNLPLERGI